MIKQRKPQKVTEYGKRRVNVFELEKQVKELERKERLQMDINARNNQLNRQLCWDIENIKRHLQKFELRKEKGFLARALDRFWSFLGR